MEIDKALEKEVNRQLEIIKFGTVDITPENELKGLLAKSLTEKKPLRVKCGIDPTTSDVHLGHLVPYRKMRQFQDLGHIGVVIIGDYTARIGDPTGKNESRPALTKEQVDENAKRYMDQVYSVLDPDKTEIRRQSEWFQGVGLADVMGWAAQTTVAKLISHDTFKVRLEKNLSLGLHELFYPVLQGIDSVFIKADIELGGSDQRFNVLMGRDYQKNAGLTQQVAILTPLLIGLDGKEKMSKSLGNYIGVLDEPFDKFGKVMSIPDELMANYYMYALQLAPEEFNQIVSKIKNNEVHPNEAKKDLAQRVVSFFHGDATGKSMREQFESVFKKGQVPDDTPEYSLKDGETLIDVLVGSKLLGSNSEVRRMVKQGAIRIVDGDKIEDAQMSLDSSFKDKVIKVGKRKFLRIK